METVNQKNSVQAFDLSTNKLPNLHSAKVLPMDLTSEYWTPEKEGEYKVCFFQEIKTSTYTDEQTGETIELPCVILLEQSRTGELKTIRNGSKRLVASLESAMKTEKIVQGTPLKIQYLGKQKNSTNSFKSDVWSVKPLIVQNEESKEQEIAELFAEKKDFIHTDELPHIERIIDEKELTSYDKVLIYLRELVTEEPKAKK